MNVKRQGIPFVHNSSYKFILIVLKFNGCNEDAPVFFLNKILRVFVYCTGSTILSLYKDRVHIEKISPGGGCTNNAFNN